MTELVIGELTAVDLAEFGAAFDFTEAWLRNRRFSENTREAYRRDIHQWLDWCAQHDLDPLQVTFLHVNAWARSLEAPDDRRKPLAPASIARKMSAVSSWYMFIVKLGKLPANPAAVADRPAVDRDYSSTPSFTRDDAQAMLRVVSVDDPYLGRVAPLLAEWMVDMGTRATETSNIQVEHLGWDEGHRVVQLTLKGGRRKLRPLPYSLAVLLDEYLAHRAAGENVEVQQLSGPLFVNARGQQIDRKDLARFVRRLAIRAGVKNANRITPHSFRHAWNTMARNIGAALEDRQDAMGHADPRTTRRYDRAGRSLIHDPALLVADAVARREDRQEPV